MPHSAGQLNSSDRLPHEFQASYCRGYSTVDHIFTQENIVHFKWAQDKHNKKVYAFLWILNRLSTLYIEKYISAKLVTANDITQYGEFIMEKNNVPFGAKLKIFPLFSHAYVLWGGTSMRCQEKLQRFFLKKVFGLPQCTLSYFLLLGTDLNILF